MSDNVQTLIESQGFALVRQRKHKVFQDANGRSFTIPSTPSDRRAADNIIASLSRVLGKKKRDLLAPKTPKKKHRTMKLEPINIIESKPAPVAVVAPVMDRPYTKAETKMLKRLEKYEAARTVKQAKSRDKRETLFDELARDISAAVMSVNGNLEDCWNASAAIVSLLHERGYHEAQLFPCAVLVSENGQPADTLTAHAAVMCAGYLIDATAGRFIGEPWLVMPPELVKTMQDTNQKWDGDNSLIFCNVADNLSIAYVPKETALAASDQHALLSDQKVT